MITEEKSRRHLSLASAQRSAANINLVTGAHVCADHPRAHACPERGLTLPVVYNSSGYECIETLHLLDGQIDIYLPDYKYYSSYYAGLYSHAPDYRDFAVPAIDEMVRQTGAPQFDENGMLTRGTVIRHLMLPGLGGDTSQILRDIAVRWGKLRARQPHAAVHSPLIWTNILS